MTTLFAVKNNTSETWPAFGMARLGDVLQYDGVNEDAPLYELKKPDGETGIYVVNGAAPLAATREGTAVYYLDAQFVAVEATSPVAYGMHIGAVRKRWTAAVGGISQMMATDEKNDLHVVPIAPPPNQRIQVIMKEDLLAAVNSLNDPSTAMAYLLVKNAAGDLVKTRIEKEIVNRFKNISVDRNVYAKAETMDGEWQLYAADCPDDSSSSDSEPFASE